MVATALPMLAPTITTPGIFVEGAEVDADATNAAVAVVVVAETCSWKVNLLRESLSPIIISYSVKVTAGKAIPSA